MSGEIGVGVFATADIPRGTVIWALDALDQRLGPEHVRALGSRYGRILDRWAYRNVAGEYVLCWDLARWVNHACEPNALSSGWDFDLAVRDIQAGEEITNDYAALNLDRSFACLCGHARCRRTVRASDFGRLADGWDAAVRDAFVDITRVPQPLWSWVRPRRAIAAAIRNPSRLPSVREHRMVRAAGPAPSPARAARSR